MLGQTVENIPECATVFKLLLEEETKLDPGPKLLPPDHDKLVGQLLVLAGPQELDQLLVGIVDFKASQRLNTESLDDEVLDLEEQ